MFMIDNKRIEIKINLITFLTLVVYLTILKVSIWELTLMHNQFLLPIKKQLSKLIKGGGEGIILTMKLIIGKFKFSPKKYIDALCGMKIRNTNITCFPNCEKHNN